jgi:hypothetical protein
MRTVGLELSTGILPGRAAFTDVSALRIALGTEKPLIVDWGSCWFSATTKVADPVPGCAAANSRHPLNDTGSTPAPFQNLMILEGMPDALQPLWSNRPPVVSWPRGFGRAVARTRVCIKRTVQTTKRLLGPYSRVQWAAALKALCSNCALSPARQRACGSGRSSQLFSCGGGTPHPREQQFFVVVDGQRL